MAELLAQIRATNAWSMPDLACALQVGLPHAYNLINSRKLPLLHSALAMADRLGVERLVFAQASLQNMLWSEGLNYLVRLSRPDGEDEDLHPVLASPGCSVP